jgi:Legionella pneumophila major outer membrane protein precursor
MNKSFIGVLLLGATCASRAYAGERDDILARLDAIEKENAAIRKENVALLENKRLREQNSKLKSASTAPTATRLAAAPTPVETVAPPPPAAAAPRPETSSSSFEPLRATRSLIGSFFDSPDEKKDPFGAYAADLPSTYKAAPEQHGQLRIWAEGGAVWTGGDPVQQNFNITNFSNPINALSAFGGTGGGNVGQFDLTPKIGWDAATGFDYRFAGSPWHVSMDFRYGEGGATNGTVSSAGSFSLATLAALLGGGGGIGGLAGASGSFGGSETLTTSYNESHWIADFAVGRDVFSSGADAMQVKTGIRFGGYTDNLNTSDNTNFFLNVNPAIPFSGIPISAIGISTQTLTQTADSFLGAGPRVGIEGSIPFAGNWALDYLGDAAILFGTERSSTTTIVNSSVFPAILAALGGGLGGPGSISTTTAQRFSSVFSGDVQVGIGYWITSSMKLAASYRFDTMIHMQNTSTAAVTTLTPDRYWQGPRLTLTGRFDAL